MDGITNKDEVNDTTERKLGDTSRKKRFTKVAKKTKRDISHTGIPEVGKGTLLSEVMDKG